MWRLQNILTRLYHWYDLSVIQASGLKYFWFHFYEVLVSFKFYYYLIVFIISFLFSYFLLLYFLFMFNRNGPWFYVDQGPDFERYLRIRIPTQCEFTQGPLQYRPGCTTLCGWLIYSFSSVIKTFLQYFSIEDTHFMNESFIKISRTCVKSKADSGLEL